MKNAKWFLKTLTILILIVFIIVITSFLLIEDKNTEKTNLSEEVFEKGYDLPIEAKEKAEAAIPDEILGQIQERIKESGSPVNTSRTYSNMENYSMMDTFLKNSSAGNSGAIVMYEVHSDGGSQRNKFIFDATDMYVLGTRTEWGADSQPGSVYAAYTKIKEWRYTEKGWFCYQLCVKEHPEVTEIVDGSCMIRVKPMKEEYRELSLKYVRGLGYQGNNLLASNWDAGNLEGLDYNGLYEYLYKMKHQGNFVEEDYQNGIPKEEFEAIIMEYIPVTSEQIQQYAVYDEKTNSYAWERLGCLNYAPNFFGTSIPEVTDMKKNDDGTITLTVDAVCEMRLGNEAFITHELTVRLYEDGSFQYCSNKILEDGTEKIPTYQYCITK